jgi:hypothetical protein
MLLTRPYSVVTDPPKTNPALKPPIDSGYRRPRKIRTPPPPDAPMNQPPLTSSIEMVPESARAVDDTPAPAKAKRATRAARNPGENRMVESPWVKARLEPESPRRNQHLYQKNGLPWIISSVCGVP